MTIRLLSLCYEYPPIGGGGAKVVHGLARVLRRGDLEIDLVTMTFDDLPRREQLPHMVIHRAWCPRRRLSMCSALEMIPYLLTSLRLALGLVRHRHHALNHSHFIYPDGVTCYLLKRLTGLPYAITAHGSDVPGYNPDRFRTLHWWLLPFWRRIVREARVIVCPSETIRRLVLTHCPSARTTVIPNGIEPGRFTPDPVKQRRILVVSRLFERKGVQHLLEALAGIPNDFEVHVVGDGPYLPNLRAMARRSRLDVRFHGFLANDGEQLKHLYESSRIFVFLSSRENFPIVLLEAMSAGLAVLTSTDPGCAEVVGEAGIVVDPLQVELVRRQLLRLMADPELCASLGRTARRRIEAQFTWTAVAERYRDMLGTLLAAPSTPLPATPARNDQAPIPTHSPAQLRLP